MDPGCVSSHRSNNLLPFSVFCSFRCSFRQHDLVSGHQALRPHPPPSSYLCCIHSETFSIGFYPPSSRLDFSRNRVGSSRFGMQVWRPKPRDSNFRQLHMSLSSGNKFAPTAQNIFARARVCVCVCVCVGGETAQVPVDPLKADISISISHFFLASMQ